MRAGLHGARVLAVLLLLLAAGYAQADDRPYELSADRYVTVAGEAVSIRLTLANGDERVEALQHDGRGSLRPAGSENRVEIVNGRVSQVTAQRYRFVAQKPGRYTVGPAVIRTAAGVVRSNTIEIVVQPPGDARYFELHHSVHPPVVFEGQPFALVVTAVHGTDLRPVGWTPPRATGVRSLIDPDRIEPVGGRVQRGQRIFQQITIAQWLVAEQPGQPALRGARLDVEYPNRRPRRAGGIPSPFGFDDWDMFGSRMSRNSVEVPPVRVTVRPLPPVPEGVQFVGAVGHLTVTWERLERSARQWRGVLHLRGEGAAIAFDVDAWTEQGWKIWPDTPQVSHRAQGTTLELDIQVPVTLVPAAGEAADRPGWFDPFSGSWMTVPALPVAAAATGETIGTGSSVAPGPRQQAAPPGQGALLVVQPDPAWSGWLSLRGAEAAAAAAVVMLALLFVGGRLRRERQEVLDVPRLLTSACDVDEPERWRLTEQQLAAMQDDDLALAARRMIAEALYRPDPHSPRDEIRNLLQQRGR